MRHASDLETLIRSSAPGSQRDRLRRVHDLLVEAGQLPELPPSLQHPPQLAVHTPRFERTRTSLPRVAAAAAAAFVIAAAGSAYMVLGGGSGEPIRGVFAMYPTAAAPDASGRLTIGDRDHAGNWPITLHVRGLPALPAGSVYQMNLTAKGRLVGSCGVFRTDGGTTIVHLTVPYRLGEYSGWTITRQTPHQSLFIPMLTTG